MLCHFRTPQYPTWIFMGLKSHHGERAKFFCSFWFDCGSQGTMVSRCMKLVTEVIMVSTHCAWNIILFVGQEVQTWWRCETLGLCLTNLTYTESALVINSSQQERRLAYLNYIIIVSLCHRKGDFGMFSDCVVLSCSSGFGRGCTCWGI